MPSQALQDFEVRLAEVQQLIDAHDALTRLRKAEATLQAGGNKLANIALVINDLVTDPGRGRRKEVHALNNAAIALLSGHLQGYVVDLFKESAAALLADHVHSIDALTAAANTRGNPNPNNIRKMYASLGFDDIFAGISWQNMSTDALKSNLSDFNTLRNSIVHGTNQRVQKQRVVNHLKVFQNFANRLDTKLAREIRAATGRQPW